MDPEATLERIVDALERNDKDEAKAAIGDLRKWMNAKGFMPKMEFHTFEFLLGSLADRL